MSDNNIDKIVVQFKPRYMMTNFNAFGYCKNDTIEIRKDLSLPVKLSILTHEFYHYFDKKSKFREIRAILAQLVYPIVGFIWIIVLSLNRDRIELWKKRIFK